MFMRFSDVNSQEIGFRAIENIIVTAKKQPQPQEQSNRNCLQQAEAELGQDQPKLGLLFEIEIGLNLHTRHILQIPKGLITHTL